MFQWIDLCQVSNLIVTGMIFSDWYKNIPCRIWKFVLCVINYKKMKAVSLKIRFFIIFFLAKFSIKITCTYDFSCNLELLILFALQLIAA